MQPDPCASFLSYLPPPLSRELRRYTVTPIADFKMEFDGLTAASFRIADEGEGRPQDLDSDRRYAMVVLDEKLDDYNLDAHQKFLNDNRFRASHFRMIWSDRHLDFPHTTREKMLYDIAQTHVQYGRHRYLVLIPGESPSLLSVLISPTVCCWERRVRQDRRV